MRNIDLRFTYLLTYLLTRPPCCTLCESLCQGTTWLTNVRLSLTLPLGAIYVPPVVVTYSFRDTISLPMTVGLFLLQARLPGTFCVTGKTDLCDELREPSDRFRQLLKTRLFAEY